MNKDLSIQVFSVRDKMTTAEDTSATFKALASYGYKGVQTAGAFAFGVEEYAAAAKDAGLRVVGTHLNIDILSDIDEAVKIHKTLGTKYAGIGSMPGLWEADFSADTVYNFIEKANNVISKLKENGLTFTYHHHDREFAKIGNETIMEILIRELDQSASFVLDTYWLQTGGVNILEWLGKLEGRVKILHLKDYVVPFDKRGGMITQLGSGNINFKEVIKAAEAYGVEDLCYEQDNAVEGDSLAFAKASAEYFYSII